MFACALLLRQSFLPGMQPMPTQGVAARSKILMLSLVAGVRVAFIGMHNGVAPFDLVLDLTVALAGSAGVVWRCALGEHHISNIYAQACY